MVAIALMPRATKRKMSDELSATNQRIPNGWHYRMLKIADLSGEDVQWVYTAAVALFFERGTPNQLADAVCDYRKKLNRNWDRETQRWAMPKPPELGRVVQQGLGQVPTLSEAAERRNGAANR